MDFLRTRTLAYLIGAVEFADNIRLNILDSVFTFEPRGAPSWKNLEGKTCIITGGNAGIGLATAAAVAKHGSRVVLACRSLERGSIAAKVIGDRTCDGTPGKVHEVEVKELDLGSLESVRRFAKAFNSEHRRLDLLICNAGIMAPPERLQTADGMEQQFQVNYLGHFLLAHELMAYQRKHSKPLKNASDKIRGRHQQRSEESASDLACSSDDTCTRVIFLSSMTHRAGNLDFSDLQLHRSYSGFKGYANSKLATLLAAKEFQRHFDRSPSTRRDVAVAVHPGLVDTELARGWLTGADVVGTAAQRFVAPVAKILAPWLLVQPERAVESILYAATAPADEVAGQYVAGGRTTRPAREACDTATAEKLWDVSCKLTEMQPSF